MLALDEEDYETLGWGAQRATEELARHETYLAAYKREYIRQWRKDNPDKHKAIYTKRWKTIKADPIKHAKAKAQQVKYCKSAKGKESKRKRNQRYYEKAKRGT